MNYIIVTNRGLGDITQKKDFTPENLKKFGDLDYVFIPFWSWYIPSEIYGNWECVIFHMTDLPFGRGASPLQNLIMRGYKETKISALRCFKEIDAGPIYCKRPLSLDGSANQIYERADRIIRTQMIPYILGNKLIPEPQVGTPVYFEKWTNNNIYDFIRMLETDYEGTGPAKYESPHNSSTS